MGYLYETGSSVTKDLAEAKRDYGLAQASNPLAKSKLKRLNKGGAGAPSISNVIDY
jgi:TPR repeat protein